MSSVKQQEFIQQIIDKGNRELSNESFAEFLLTKVYVRRDGEYQLYSFEGHHYLQEICSLMDKAQDFRAMKGAQVVLSTTYIGESLKKGDKGSLKIVWFFPTETSMKKFVQDRWQEIIKRSPYVKKRIEQTNSTNNVELIKYADATFAFRATETMEGAKTIDADFIYFDELDEQNVEHLIFAEDRISHSKYGFRRSASQPSFPNFGIHAEWLDGTQHMYLNKCSSCNHWTNIVESFLQDDEPTRSRIWIPNGQSFACQNRKCNRPLNMQKGTYVAKKTKHKNTSVQVSQFFTNARTAKQHREKWMDSQGNSLKLKNFYISVLGWPYSTEEESPITQSILDQHRGDHGIPKGCHTFTYMGADQGDIVHMLFGELTSTNKIKIYPAKFSVLETGRIDQSIQNFQVYSGIVDALPNKAWSVRTAQKFRDFIRIQYFAKKYSTTSEEIVSEDENEGIEVVNVNRDESLQDTVDAIKAGMFLFPDKRQLSGPDLTLAEELDFHLTMLVRERGEDENGKPKYSFKKKVPNHFGMALNSLRLAYKLGPL
ncbi:phage terminase large subunit family protein [Leptospira interrogans]|uniref:phage terminase large subunit family protein n=1 Tax=Leptospira interrogans TaxID=173 RepID=UPI0002DA52A4|nr:phage terminase large subunit family protein [Leptospira interrogans]OOB99146.1 terminase [Leptospira interrogans serovar Australis]